MKTCRYQQVEGESQDLRLKAVDAFDANDVRTDVRAAGLRQIPDKARDSRAGAEARQPATLPNQPRGYTESDRPTRLFLR